MILLPTVHQMHFFSTFREFSATMRRYAAVQPWGMSVCLIKNIGYVTDDMCGRTPWYNMPILLFVLPIQYYFSGTTKRWWYSSKATVLGSMAE